MILIVTMNNKLLLYPDDTAVQTMLEKKKQYKNGIKNLWVVSFFN